ncbi:MAG: anthranilate synthase component I family protein [Bermanella sp.]
MKLETTPLPYLANTSRLLNLLSSHGNLVALESANDAHENGRWSIISAGPIRQLNIAEPGNTPSLLKELEDFFALLPQQDHRLPFIGGLLGHVSYDLGKSATKKPTHGLSFANQPKLLAGLYTWAFVIDHVEAKTHLVYWHGISTVTQASLLQLFTRSHQVQEDSFELTRPFSPLWQQQHYQQKIQSIHDYINNGDCYQINLAQCFKAAYRGSTIAAYQRLKEAAQVPYASYFECDELHFASLSPEMFIHCDAGHITTKPIKGTQPRGSSPTADEHNKRQLKESRKDRAENLMIVDLLRNDLSINATQVRVPKLFNIESFTTVHHLVSTITAQLKPESSPLRLFLEAFPGGSITGAPKKRAMEIIAELEGFPRSFYCGSAFYYSVNGNFSSNILIRSFLFQDDEILTWSGGGIIADSKWQLEYQESLDKISRLMGSLER